jgi:hypothetical protein
LWRTKYSGYSALLALNDTHAGLVYESGAYSALTFRTIDLRADDNAELVQHTVGEPVQHTVGTGPQ